MKNIVLICAGGMSTSMLVVQMKDAMKEMGVECEISAHSMSLVKKVGQDADIILLGPQVAFELKKVQTMFPNIPVKVIDMKDYGMMDGKAVMKMVANTITIA